MKNGLESNMKKPPEKMERRLAGVERRILRR